MAVMLAAGGAAFGLACGPTDDDGEAPKALADASVKDATTTTTTVDASTALSDGQIFQVLHVINLDELTEANTAAAQASSPAVRQLAGDILVANANADELLSQFAIDDSVVSAGSATADALTAITAADETTYASLSGGAFDQSYLSAQVSVQNNVLEVIATQLLPEVVNPNLRSLVAQAHDLAALHLLQLEAIQADAGAGDSGGGSDAAEAAAAADAADARAGDAGNVADAADGADGSNAAADASDGGDAGDAGDEADAADADGGDSGDAGGH